MCAEPQRHGNTILAFTSTCICKPLSTSVVHCATHKTEPLPGALIVLPFSSHLSPTQSEFSGLCLHLYVWLSWWFPDLVQNFSELARHGMFSHRLGTTLSVSPGHFICTVLLPDSWNSVSCGLRCHFARTCSVETWVIACCLVPRGYRLNSR